MFGSRRVQAIGSLPVAVLVASLLAACGDDKGRGTIEPEATPSRRTPAMGTDPVPPAPMPKIAPPTLPPVPPGKTRITDARFVELGSRDVEGFKRTVVKAGKSLVVTFESEKANGKGVKTYVIATIENCVVCQPMDVAAWKENKNLRGMLTPVAAGDPGLVFDVHEIDLGTKKGIGIYKASFVSAAGSTASTHGYQAWFNDGANQILIDVSPRGLFPTSKEEMLAGISRDDMAAVAKAVFAVYASEFSSRGLALPEAEVSDTFVPVSPGGPGGDGSSAPRLDSARTSVRPDVRPAEAVESVRRDTRSSSGAAAPSRRRGRRARPGRRRRGVPAPPSRARPRSADRRLVPASRARARRASRRAIAGRDTRARSDRSSAPPTGRPRTSNRRPATPSFPSREANRRARQRARGEARTTNHGQDRSADADDRVRGAGDRVDRRRHREPGRREREDGDTGGGAEPSAEGAESRRRVPRPTSGAVVAPEPEHETGTEVSDTFVPVTGGGARRGASRRTGRPAGGRPRGGRARPGRRVVAGRDRGARASDVITAPSSPQGLKRRNGARSVDTLSASPCHVTQRRTAIPRLITLRGPDPDARLALDAPRLDARGRRRRGCRSPRGRAGSGGGRGVPRSGGRSGTRRAGRARGRWPRRRARPRRPGSPPRPPKPPGVLRPSVIDRRVLAGQQQVRERARRRARATSRSWSAWTSA